MGVPSPIRSVSVVGLGRLGLPLAAAFAGSGTPTVAVDIDVAKIDALRAGRAPYEESGLADLLARAATAIAFTTDAAMAAGTDATVFFLPTPAEPEDRRYSADMLLSAVEEVARAVAAADKHDHVFIVGSTVMPGTMDSGVAPAIGRLLAGRSFGLAYVPEFAALGDLIRGYSQPEFLLIGRSSAEVGDRVAKLYSRIHTRELPIESVALIDAEIAKISLNNYICMKISFANFLGQYCAARGDADVDAVTRVLGRDARIGAGYLSAGMAYGGPCFGRDTGAFAAMANTAGLGAGQIDATEAINRDQKMFAVETIIALRPRSVAILGVAFKPGTPVIDASPSLDLASGLIALGVRVGLFDFSEEVRREVRLAGADWHPTVEDAVKSHDCLAITHRDHRFKVVLDILRPDQYAVDFWGILPDGPGVLRPGRHKAPRARPGAPA